MGLFSRSRRRQDSTADPDAGAAADSSDRDDEFLDEAVGPRDSGGGLCPEGFLDLGALYIPVVPGMQLRAQYEDQNKSLRRIMLVIGNSGIQISVAAAPRSGGVWDELREQVSQSIRQMNGTVEEVETKYGLELAATVPVRLPDGGEGRSPLRIIAVEGPRWLARIDLQGGAAAGDDEQRRQCEEIIDRIIVNRGSDPRVRLELLPLTLPRSADDESA